MATVLRMTTDAEFSQIVSSLLVLYLPSGHCSMRAIARHLGIHRSTLRRRLASTHHSYSSLVQTVRVGMVSRLCLTNRSLTEIARQLGFSDLSVFSRWFNTTFGCSATSWRRMQVVAEAA
jgi:AraC-like DNA-binding protein